MKVNSYRGIFSSSFHFRICTAPFRIVFLYYRQRSNSTKDGLSKIVTPGNGKDLFWFVSITDSPNILLNCPNLRNVGSAGHDPS